MFANLEKAALLVLDVQKDFCPGGSLEVKEGDVVVPVINRIVRKFFKVIATMDWHPKDHVSFASNHPGMKIFDSVDVNGVDQLLWPDHCVQGTRGADFYPGLEDKYFDIILRKGSDSLLDSYSAFYENDKKTPTGLEYYLKNVGVSETYICGLATDYCVFYSAIDSVKTGFNTKLIIDATRGVDVPQGNVKKAVDDMKLAGVTIVRSQDLAE
jgi:nicotinamidase/pyrazinamidase